MSWISSWNLQLFLLFCPQSNETAIFNRLFLLGITNYPSFLVMSITLICARYTCSFWKCDWCLLNMLAKCFSIIRNYVLSDFWQRQYTISHPSTLLERILAALLAESFDVDSFVSQLRLDAYAMQETIALFRKHLIACVFDIKQIVYW